MQHAPILCATLLRATGVGAEDYRSPLPPARGVMPTAQHQYFDIIYQQRRICYPLQRAPDNIAAVIRPSNGSAALTRLPDARGAAQAQAEATYVAAQGRGGYQPVPTDARKIYDGAVGALPAPTDGQTAMRASTTGSSSATGNARGAPPRAEHDFASYGIEDAEDEADADAVSSADSAPYAYESSIDGLLPKQAEQGLFSRCQPTKAACRKCAKEPARRVRRCVRRLFKGKGKRQ